LINFWFVRIQANKAAIKAIIMNKFGDYALFMAILLIHFTFKTLDYSSVFVLVPFFLNKTTFLFNIKCNLINLISGLLFIGAIGKSAQIGLHT
jgi:NADH-ubiquinone oxidoreductase chain 5